MVDDIAELVEDQKLSGIILLGHSMGGRVAMQYATQHADKLDKLIVADMAPKAYPPHHDAIIEALLSVDFALVKSRHEVDQQLSLFIKDNGTKQFLLKNLYWKNDTQLGWRFNLDVIARNYKEIGVAFDPDGLRCYTPSWFIRGERSDYILDSDWPFIQQIFPDSQLLTIPGAGHWVHADQPRLFYETVLKIAKPGQVL
jgi:pimeloyl-ACP methyl ester carboxylesterase